MLFREKARIAPDHGTRLERVEINLCVTLMEKEWPILILDQRQSENAYQVNKCAQIFITGKKENIKSWMQKVDLSNYYALLEWFILSYSSNHGYRKKTGFILSIFITLWVCHQILIWQLWRQCDSHAFSVTLK